METMRDRSYAHRCSFCGDELPSGARFCVACGKAVVATGATERLNDDVLHIGPGMWIGTTNTGATERSDDDTLYVTQEEYIALLSDALAVRSNFTLTDDDFVLYRGRIVRSREE